MQSECVGHVPGGFGCRVQAWKPGFSHSRKCKYDLTVTEFAGQVGKATYFRLCDYSYAVDDELLGAAEPIQ